MLALFELFREVGLAALELHSMIPVGTLQDYQVEPIFKIMKAIAGNDDHWIEQVALFAILQENDKLRHALNKCLIQWVLEETMPPSVRYQVAMWLAGNTGRLFEYGPQSEVLRILLRWAELDDAGWLSLEQRMDVYAVTLVNGCSKHQERARALVCNLDEPERGLLGCHGYHFSAPHEGSKGHRLLVWFGIPCGVLDGAGFRVCY